jgi:hypothetical protein
MYPSIGSGSASRNGVTRTSGVTNAMAIVAAANATARERVERKAPQSAPAAEIDGPMMFRMSTFRSDLAGPFPSTQA